MNAANWSPVAVVFLTLGLLGFPATFRVTRWAEHGRADFYADPVSDVDWDNALEWLLYDEGVWVEPARLPVSDEELLDLADVVGVLR